MEQQVCVEIVSCNEDLKINFVSGVGDDDDENVKEKRKGASSAKKPPKPPRSQTHRAFSLDAADQKLIRELAMIKRARMERMKGLLLQKKASKSSSSSSSHSTLFAMIFTIVVFIVVLFQGMSCQISCGTFQGSPPPLETNESGLIFIHEELNPSAHDSSDPNYISMPGWHLYRE
uniref:Transmembrane protein n=1 Tax=Helianthus annuus TaxID=4232 RepID=A0A251VTZ1_HELAN